ELTDLGNVIQGKRRRHLARQTDLGNGNITQEKRKCHLEQLTW
ncbi:2095_t:CDS:1, partial [Gigaspora rosea]